MVGGGEVQRTVSKVPGRSIEPRWQAVLAILTVLVLVVGVPGQLRLFPGWVPYVIALSMLLSTGLARLTRGHPLWLQLERRLLLVFTGVSCLANVAGLGYLLRAALSAPEVTGLQLLASGISVAVTNVLNFSLLYWCIDRGGPEARVGHAGFRPDWLFPQEGIPTAVPADWHPTFVDYLYLGFTTATAFSPTDVLPLTSRAKLLMMLESTIGLITLVIIAARAINILG
jgi:hypothetical protein